MRYLLPFLHRLPNNVQAFLKESLKPIGQLDYPQKPIYIYADTEWELDRCTPYAKEPETVQWLERILRPDDIFFDIGANVGSYSLIASAICPEIKIFAFEPSATTFAQLTRNIILNDLSKKIIALNFGLAETTALRTFSPSSLISGAAEHEWISPDRISKTAYTVATYQLDHLIAQFQLPPPTILKVDVDGYESAVLRGSSNALRTVRKAMVEVNMNSPEELHFILEFMSTHGLTSTQKINYRKILNIFFER